MLGWGIDVPALETRCPGGHQHVRFEGQYTTASAIYVPALAEFLAKAFVDALRRKRVQEEEIMEIEGVELVLCNDLLLNGEWSLEFASHWRSPSHINILESSAYVALLKKIARESGNVGFTTLLDGRDAKCSHAKGRSSAKALQPTLRKGTAWQIAGGLYPALGFAPTRLNVADDPPGGGNVVSCGCGCRSLAEKLPLDFLRRLHSTCLSRVAAAWVRLTLLASCFQATDGWHCQPPLWILFPAMDFDICPCLQPDT